MRNLDRPDLNTLRRLHPGGGGWGDGTCGVFVLRSPIDGGDLRVIASSGAGWDHVSVSRAKRCPNWPEMDFVCRQFFADDELVIQYHIPPSENISFHSYCLHMWRPQAADMPRPPNWMVVPPVTDADKQDMADFIEASRR